MRALLLLSLAAASAVASAERGMRHGMGPPRPEAAMPCHHERDEGTTGLMAVLNEHFQRSSEMLQRFFSLGAPQETEDATVRIVLIEEEEEPDDPALERKRACLKALEKIHEQDALQQQAEMLVQYFRSAFDMVSLQLWSESSCEDLGRPEIIKQCNVVLKAEDVVKKFLQDGKTDDEVCDVMSVVSDLEGTDNLSCKLCQRFVQMVDQALEQEVQQVQQVRAIIGDLCDAMAADSMCHTFLKNYDAIVDWLKHGTDPLVVCARIAMCSSDSSSARQIAASPEDSETIEDGALVTSDFFEDDQSCFFCTRVAGVIYQVNSLFPEQLPVLKAMLGNVCQMASPRAKCQEVEANFDRIVELARQGQHPREICGNMEFCPMEPHRGMPPSEMIGDDKTCVYCDAATTVVEVILQEAPEQIDQIRDYADMICSMLGDDSPCHVYVNQLDTVIDSLKKGVHPRDICKALNYCSANRLDAPPQLDENPRVGMMRNGPLGMHHRVGMMGPGGRHGRHGHHGGMDMVHGGEHPPHPPHPHPHGSCFFCSRVAIVIHHVNHTSPEKLPIVKKILTNVCQLVPSDCKCDVVDKNFDKIVEMEKRPHEICKSLGVCNKTGGWEDGAHSIADEMKGVVVAAQWPPGNATQCSYCQFATTVAKIALQQYGADIRQIRTYADMICDMLGSDNPCQVYMKEFDFVIDSITKGMSSKAICTELKFCTAVAVASPASDADLSAFNPALVQMVKDSMERSIDGCFFCTQVASVIEVAVAEDPSKITEIRQIADVVCGMLPSDNQCHSFVKQFDTVVDSLQKGEQPKAICHDLKYCTTDTNPAMTKLAGPSSDMIAVQSARKGGNTCAYCSGVVTVLKFALEQKPEQIKEMREAAGIVCQLLPADDACHDDLKMFDEAVTDLQAGKEAHEICQTLKFCTALEDSSSLMSGLLDFKGSDFLPSKCATCQQNTLLLASLITRPESLATFEREINSICRLIPNSSECELLMKHQDVIIDSLKKNEDVETICTRIAACEPTAVKEVPEENSMSVGCLFCEYTAELLKYAKNNEKALHEAKMTLETMCTVLPPRARCDALSSKFDDLLSLMREGKSPSEACHAIALCDAAFVYSPTSSGDSDPIEQAFEKARQSMGHVMEIQ